jgi:hypothetical protein
LISKIDGGFRAPYNGWEWTGRDGDSGAVRKWGDLRAVCKGVPLRKLDITSIFN